MALSEGGTCHCEESDDEAISNKTKIASLLAMTRLLNFMPLPGWERARVRGIK